MMSSEQIVKSILKKADIDVAINGPNAWDPLILTRDKGAFYRSLLARGSLGLGEAYMDGSWRCREPEAMPEFFNRVIGARLDEVIRKYPSVALRVASQHAYAKLVDRQSVKRAQKVGRVHYDDRLFATSVYDTRMTGSCAYWPGAKTLDEAQTAKLDRVINKLGISAWIERHPGETCRILNIGCGWGSLEGRLWERFADAVVVVGVTISEDQVRYARERYAGRPYTFLVKDYREFIAPLESFDFVVSIGMFEHVGPAHYDEYFAIARKYLKPDGLFLLHTITQRVRGGAMDPFINEYIFPGGALPTEGQMLDATEAGGWICEHLENIGANYDPTLSAWLANLRAKKDEFQGPLMERKFRMYEYYLASCAGGFRSRGINVAQLVLSPNGVRGGYVFAAG